MARLLIIPILAFFASFPISYFVRGKRWEGDKKSREYFGKFFWGFRTFLFPSINLLILLSYGLKPFCISLLVFSLISIFSHHILQIKGSNSLSNKIGYVWYLFLGLTFFLSDPYWIQIWPSLFFGSLFLAAIFAALIKRSTQFTELISDTEHTSNSKTLILALNWMLPILSLVLFSLNEFFRRETSFEAWAFYNAFSKPMFVLIVGILTVIFVPIFFRD